MCRVPKAFKSKKNESKKATAGISSNAFPTTMNQDPTTTTTTTTTATATVSKLTGSAEMDQKMGTNEQPQKVSRSNEMIAEKKNKTLKDMPLSIRSDYNSLKPPSDNHHAKRNIEGKRPSRNDPQYVTLMDVNNNDWDKDNDGFSAYIKNVELQQQNQSQGKRNPSNSDELVEDVTQPSSVH